MLTRPRIITVWRALGGGTLAGRGNERRGRAFWRKGDGWNVAVNLEKGLWADHATNEGGGIIDLVEKVLACSRGQALQWLNNLTGTAPLTAEQKRDYAKRRNLCNEEAEKIWKQFIDMVYELQQYRQLHFDLYHEIKQAFDSGEDMPADDQVAMREEARDLLRRMRTLDSVWDALMKADPGDVARLMRLRGKVAA